MRYAWEYVLKAAQNLHARGQPTLTATALFEEVMRLGWPKDPTTFRTHISAHMRADRPTAPRPYLDRVARDAYQLNEEGKRAVQGL